MTLQKAKVISEKGMTFDIIKKSKWFPPREILNTFFLCGLDDADSEITLEWTPFSLDPTDYRSFFQDCNQRYGGLRIKDFGCCNYQEWFSLVALSSQVEN